MRSYVDPDQASSVVRRLLSIPNTKSMTGGESEIGSGAA